MSFDIGRLAPSPNHGYSPTDGFGNPTKRKDSLSTSLLSDLHEPSFAPWENASRNKFRLADSEFPALGPKRDMFSSQRTNSSPQFTSIRPPSVPENQPSDYRPLPVLNDVNLSLFEGSLPLPSHIPGLSMSSSSVQGYLSSLSKTGEIGEFSIQKEDFPALGKIGGGSSVPNPPSSNPDTESNRDFDDGSVLAGYNSSTPTLIQGLKDPRNEKLLQSLRNRPACHIGRVQYDSARNSLDSIPNTMLTDPHSFLGCLKVLKEVIGDKRRANPYIASCELDKDLTHMGLSFIKDNRLIHRFQSPFAEIPCRAQDIDMFVPSEYLTNVHIREKLSGIKPNKYNEDLLFWMFYSNPNDKMQMFATEELFHRNWKYHKEEKIWISKTRNIEARFKNSSFEEGTFMVWDVESWKKVPRDMRVEYSKLAPEPMAHTEYPNQNTIEMLK